MTLLGKLSLYYGHRVVGWQIVIMLWPSHGLLAKYDYVMLSDGWLANCDYVMAIKWLLANCVNVVVILWLVGKL